MLGRWFEIEGRIVPGAGRGRTLTVPTLNVNAENELIPKMGVFVTRISLDGQPFMDSVTNIGIRPTFDESQLTIESFVLRDAVPQDAVRARLEFIRRLRDETKFESPEALRTQIAADVQQTERLFRFITKKHA
jgi:riboflavin kinase/FMN adenylyltransferase